MALEFVFWGSLFLGFYPYLVYPLLAFLMALAIRRPAAVVAGNPPKVSVLISAYNEQSCIEATVKNKLDSAYNGDLEVLIASDGSDDGTDAILERLSLEDQRIQFWRQEPRSGKTAALNYLSGIAKGEILVLADANSIYRKDTISLLVENFSDPKVGYVTGKMVYRSRDKNLVGEGTSAFIRYENSLREFESKLGSVVGVNGGVDAVRASLYEVIRPDLQSDFYLPLSVVAQRFRVIYDPRAIVEEEALVAPASEFKMRVRVAQRALWVLQEKRSLLFGAAGACYAWQLWSHKVLRYLSGIPFVLALVTGIALSMESAVYACLMSIYIVCLLLAITGHFGIKFAPARYAYYFLLLNIASTVALIAYLRGQKKTLWKPRGG